ncbi:hypothetical protein GF323_01550 [Candidatus Woesearchaeota archaeon]|nr:hypothetical protein [Candidatus Woesearchaeota archaeon]
MAVIKLFVSLKIPDTTAITAFHTLRRMGYHSLEKLDREEYYEFDVADNPDKFMKEIVKVDILVNANKHSAKICKTDEEYTNVLVTDSRDNSSKLLSTLRERMGFGSISSMSKGVLWKMCIAARNRKEIAEKITKELLYNEHYQKYKIL